MPAASWCRTSISARQSRMATVGSRGITGPGQITLYAVLHQGMKRVARGNGHGDTKSLGDFLLDLHQAKDVRDLCGRVVVHEQIDIAVGSVGAPRPRAEDE